MCPFGVCKGINYNVLEIRLVDALKREWITTIYGIFCNIHVSVGCYRIHFLLLLPESVVQVPPPPFFFGAVVTCTPIARQHVGKQVPTKTDSW
jgi:hypothetical protein